jgi:predicted nucleic acid-binding protein
VAAEVFVDAGIWYAAANAALAEHRISAATIEEALAEGATLVTTNLVVAEVHASLLRRVHRRAALSFLENVRRAPIEVVVSTLELENRAIQGWIRRYQDQDFSFADAVSFTVMTERGIEEALALGRHFVVAGFRVRPRPARRR